MNIKIGRTFIYFLFIIGINSNSLGQTIIYTDDFELGGGNWSINTADVNSTTIGANEWLLNDVYTGAPANTFLTCGNLFNNSLIPPVPNQPAGITNNPNSFYLHIINKDGKAAGVLNANYLPADGFFCVLSPENYFAKMISPISTLGQTNVSVNFWWLGATSADAIGELYYSIDGGLNWVLALGGLFNQPIWTQATVTNAAFDNQADLRLAFRFANNITLAGADPAFSVDQIELTIPSSSPPPVASFTVSDTAICVGQCINFTDLSTNSPTSWVWNFPGSISGSSNIQNPNNICYNSTGIYDVNLISTNGNGSDDTVSIGLIKVSPDVSFDVESDTTICNTGSVDIGINNLIGGLKVDSFTMTFNSQFTYTTPPTVNGGIYYIIVSGNYAGASAEGRDAAYKYMNNNNLITPIPSSMWKIDGVGPGTPCPSSYNPLHQYYFYFTGTGAGVTFSFTDSDYSDNSGSLTFEIYYLDGNILWSNGASTPCISVSPTQTTTYSVTVSNGGSCDNIDSVIVNILPPININAGPDTIICGNSPYLINGTSIGQGGSIIAWMTLGDGIFNNDTILNPIYTPGINDSINGSVELLLMAMDTSGICAPVLDTLSLQFNAKATNNAGPDDTICSGIAYSLNGILGGIATSSIWTTSGDGVFNDSSLLNAVYMPGNLDISTGFANLVFTTNDPAGVCGPAIDSLQIIIYPSPLIDSISITDPSSCIANDGSATIFATGGNLPFQYSVTGGAPFFSSNSFTNLIAGSYMAMVNDVNGCFINQNFSISALGTPPAPTVSANTSYCDGDILTDLNATSGSGGTITWYNLFGDSLGTGMTYSPFDSVGTIIYYATETLAGCESPGDSVTITINPRTITSLFLSICNNDSIMLGGEYQNTSGTYLDTLSATNGCDSILSTELTVNPLFASTQTHNICSGDSVLIGGSYQNTSGTYMDTYTASNGCDSVLTTTLTVSTISSGFQTLSICNIDSVFLGGAYQNSAGTYIDTYTASNGCDSVMTTALTVNASPVITLSNDTSIELGQSTILNVSGAESYLWTPSIGLSISTGTSVSAMPSSTTTYTVTATDSNECTAFGSVTIIVSSNNVVFLPNTFSPVSGISENSKLHVFGHSIASLELMVYDRWGEVVYKTDDIKKYDGHCCAYGIGWDGKYLNGELVVNSAVFVYKLKGTFINGEEFSLKGNITLIK